MAIRTAHEPPKAHRPSPAPKPPARAWPKVETPPSPSPGVSLVSPAPDRELADVRAVLRGSNPLEGISALQRTIGYPATRALLFAAAGRIDGVPGKHGPNIAELRASLSPRVVRSLHQVLGDSGTLALLDLVVPISPRTETRPDPTGAAAFRAEIAKRGATSSTKTTVAAGSPANPQPGTARQHSVEHVDRTAKDAERGQDLSGASRSTPIPDPRASKAVAGAQLGHVCAPRGLRLRRAPRPDAPDLGIVPFDTRVEIYSSANGWLNVAVTAQGVGAGTSELVGASGFVEGRFVLLGPPDTSSFLYLVQPGDSAARVAARFFAPPDGFSVGNDAYLFVNALWAVNQSLRTGAGLYPGAMRERPVKLGFTDELIRSESRETALRNYLGARLVAGNALWIPSLAKVRALMRSDAIASATPLSDLGEQGGMLRGLFDGIVDGLRDLVKQAKELAAFLYDLCERGLIDVVIDLVKKITKIIRQLDAKKLVAAGKAALLDFFNQWTQEDEFLRGHFQGKTIGYLIVLIVPMLVTEGLGELAAAPRALRGVQQLAAAVPRGELIGELSAGLRRAKLGDKLLESGFLKREGLVAEKFEGGLPAIEKRFDPVLDAAFSEEEPWGGFTHDRTKPTRFAHEERRINFQMERNMNKFSVAEEVQHALDFTLGAKDPKQILAMARKLKIPDEEVVNWWHRRVFTRMMKNINVNEHGLGYLKPRLAEVHKLYRDIGGKLTLDQILGTTWEGLF